MMGCCSQSTLFLCYLRYMAVYSFMIDPQQNETTPEFLQKESINITCNATDSPTYENMITSNISYTSSMDLSSSIDDRLEKNGDKEDSSSMLTIPAPDPSNFTEANGSVPLQYIPWDELHIVKIYTSTPIGVRKSAGALVQDRIVVTCCECVRSSDTNDRFSFLGHTGDEEDAIQVIRGVTGETRYVDRMSFGIRRYCIDDPDTHIGVTLILTKPFDTEPMHLTLGSSHSVCRFYAFKKKKYYGPEPSMLGHYDLNVLPFRPNAKVCRIEGIVTSRLIVCGAVVDNEQVFCKLRLGAVVICDLLLMGVSQTTCRVPYYRTNKKKTRVLAYVSVLSKEEITYWQRLINLIGENTDSSCEGKHHLNLISLLIVVAVVVPFIQTVLRP